jgi:hypothetical protein
MNDTNNTKPPLTVSERMTQWITLRDWARELLDQHKGKEIQEAAMQLAASQICEVLKNFDVEELTKKIKKGNPDDYARLILSLWRLTDGGLKYEKYRAEVAETKAKLEQSLKASESSGMTPEQLAEFRRLLDQL